MSSDIRSWKEDDGTVVFVPSSSLALDEAEARVRELVSQLPHDTVAVIGANATLSDTKQRQLLEQHGYVLAFTMVEMELTDLDSVSTLDDVEGFSFRQATSEDLPELWNLMLAAYEGRPFISLVTDGYEDFHRDDISLWNVAVAPDGRLAGHISSADDGEVCEVSVLPTFRRRGLARALLQRNLQLLRGRGLTSAHLKTNGENISGARSLYERLGFRVVTTQLRYRKRI